MKLTDASLIAVPTKDEAPVVRDHRRLTAGLHSADGRITLSAQCLNDACHWCMLNNCYCSCHDEARERKAMALELRDKFLSIYD